jgi:uncharacterized protein YbjT (DUF2867 family)
MTSKDVLIVGATGALGYSTTAEALSVGHRVRALARNPASPLIPAGVDVVKGTAESVEDLRRAAAGCEAVFYYHPASVVRPRPARRREVRGELRARAAHAIR